MTYRYLRGDAKPIYLPKYTQSAIQIGDLLWWDSTNGGVRPASEVSGIDAATRRSNLHDNFVGVALSEHPAGESGNVVIATAGEFEFAAPTGGGTDYDPGSLVGANDDGSKLENQKLASVSVAGEAVGRVARPKSASESFVIVRIKTLIDDGVQAVA